MLTRLLIAASAAVLLAGCETRDVKADLEVVVVATGWYDVGPVLSGQDAGKNKIVPSTSIRLKNISQKGISGVQIDAVFRNQGEEKIISEHYVPGVASNTTLEPGVQTAPIVLRARWGFVGPETRSQMLQNTNFRDAQITILLRHGRSGWIPVKVIPVERKLLAE
jgi:hypothetical protein